ncbi:terminase family protein [Campylobacter jejuni]|nr:hypothetical protein [Campylobacter jejuni]EAH5332496.1 hypothetical protein [Campylobacter jejuni]EAH7148450.1 hypothetical protein [Campylobacter jejuni]EAH9306694.1 hypothetical protein [Campylobacter jejuni]EAJ0168183.1 hypothetical protein [Campylobacter jejuni]
MKEFSNPPLKRVMLNMPPSYGKTETIARTFIPWALGNNPYRKFIYISYSDDLGRKINKQIRELMHSQFYRSIFSAPLFIQANSSEFILKQGGGLFVTTLKGAITGFHADSILIDDPIKVENMKSKKEREFVNQAFKDSILTRLQDKDSNITILMQRLGEDDLCGFLLNERHFSPEIIKEWKVLKMEALFIKKHDLEGLKALKAQMGDDEFFTQYQQEPQASESGFFLLENFKTIPSFEMKEQKEYIFFDGAIAINARADNRALVVVGVENHGENRVRYVLKNCFYGVWDEMQTCEHIIETLINYPNARVYMESEGGGLILHRLLQREIVRVNENLKRQNKPLINNIIEVYPANRKISKVEKIKAMRAYYNSGALVFLNQAFGLNQIKKELLSFNPEKPFRKDDCIDALASCIAHKDTLPPAPLKMPLQKSGRSVYQSGWNI